MTDGTKTLVRMVAWTLAGPQLAASVLVLLEGLVGWVGVFIVLVATSVAFTAGLYYAPRFRLRLFKENPS